MSDDKARPGTGPGTQTSDASGPPAPPGRTSKVSVTEATSSSASPQPTPRTVATEAEAEASETQTLAVTDDQDREPDKSDKKEKTATKRSRRAHLRLVSIDPWSVTKITFVLAVALGIVVTVAISILWVVLGVSGIWESINDTVSVVLANDPDSFDITDYVGYSRVIGLTLIVSAINVILITAIATIAAYLYNLSAQLVGGLHVTLSDDN